MTKQNTNATLNAEPHELHPGANYREQPNPSPVSSPRIPTPPPAAPSLFLESTTAKMSSPASVADDNHREQVTFKFCSECSNMLYPKEDPDSRKLMYTCRTCQYVEPAATSCVFRNILNSASGETAGVTQDVASDPTVSFVPWEGI